MEKGLTGVASRTPYTGSYEVEAERLGRELLRLNHRQIVSKRNVMVLFEGWDGAFRVPAFKKLLSIVEPCHTNIECVKNATKSGNDRHWLAPFWGNLPAGGCATLYFHSWYNLLASEMLGGSMAERDMLRAFDEINEFESQQNDHDTILVKLFFHNDRTVQGRELERRTSDPELRAYHGAGPIPSYEDRARHEEVWERIIEETGYRWAPWTLINAADEKTAIIEMLRGVSDALRNALPEAASEEAGASVTALAG